MSGAAASAAPFSSTPDMALKSTIFKAELQIADMDRHYYADHALTIARHPSETDERMMLRVLAFALQADEGLALCKGISDTDEPDLWVKDLTGDILRWIELGLPDERRVLKACGRARQVVVYAYGGSAARIWWEGVANKLQRAANLTVFNVAPDAMQALGAMARRSMRLQATIQDGQVMLSGDDGMVTVEPEVWRRPD